MSLNQGANDDYQKRKSIIQQQILRAAFTAVPAIIPNKQTSGLKKFTARLFIIYSCYYLSATSVITLPIQAFGICICNIAAKVGAISVICTWRVVCPGFTFQP